MSESTQNQRPVPGDWGCETDDLYLIHGIFRKIFSQSEALVREADPADAHRVHLVESHLQELLQALHNHHEHEDILWWDRLKKRAPESTADVDRMIAAHQAVAEDIADAQSLLAAWVKKPEEKEALIARLGQLKDRLFAHLADEEKSILPVASRVLSQKEWDEAHTIGQNEIPKDRLLVQIGYMLKCAPTPALRQLFLDALPGFVKLLYRLMGKKKFEREWAEIYGNLE